MTTQPNQCTEAAHSAPLPRAALGAVKAALLGDIKDTNRGACNHSSHADLILKDYIDPG